MNGLARLVIALLVPSWALAGDPPPIPDWARGVYLDQGVVDALRSGTAFRPTGASGPVVHAERVEVDHVQDTAVLQVRDLAAVEGQERTFTVGVQGMLGGGAKQTWTLSQPGGVATFDRGEGRTLLRVADVLPAAAGIDTTALQAMAMFGRGYAEADGRLWVFVYAVDENRLARARGEGRTTAAEPKGLLLRGGEGAIARYSVPPSFGYDDTLALSRIDADERTSYVLDFKGRTITLAEQDTSEGPDAVVKPGGEKIQLTRQQRPPFVVLADGLNLRAEPRAGAEKLGRLVHGDWVEVWARTKGESKVGAIPGPWVLVRRGEQLGWTFGPYLGRRLAAEREGETAWTVSAALDEMASRRFRFGREEGRYVCRIDPGSPQEERYAFTPPLQQAERAALVLANLNGDELLDPVCVLQQGAQQAICAYLSDSGDFRPAGCVTRQGTQVPALEARDADGDGQPDLHVGKESPLVAPYDPERGRFLAPGQTRAEPVARPAAPAEAKPAAPRDTERAPGCGCAGGSPPVPGPVALVAAAAALGLRARRRRI